MEKETIEIDDFREFVKLITEYKPKVKYYTKYEYHDGYSQTNETSLNLREDNDNVDEDMFDEGVEYGEYEPGKTVYDDDVYECEIKTLKIDSFIDVLNEYIELKGKDFDDWSCDTFFEWFIENGKQGKVTGNWKNTIGYNEMKDHDITWCIGFNNFNYHGIDIDTIETDNKIFYLPIWEGDYYGD